GTGIGDSGGRGRRLSERGPLRYDRPVGRVCPWGGRWPVPGSGRTARGPGPTGWDPIELRRKRMLRNGRARSGAMAVTMFGAAVFGWAMATPVSAQMVLTTTAFPDGGEVPVRFSQAAEGAAPGEGTSPALSWDNVPAEARSFVLHMHDLEVARNRTTDTQVHWLVWNVPGDARGLPEGVPRGSQLANGAYQISATGPVYRGPG